MKIAVCQTSPLTGDLLGNFTKICNAYTQAQKDGADICLLPELCLTGYLAEDLFLKPAFQVEAKKYLDQLIAKTQKNCLIIPTIISENNKLYNGAIAAMDGKEIGRTYKNKLPNENIFDEKRYFTPKEPQIIEINGVKIGIPICNDLWFPYVCSNLKQQGAEILLVPNASPFEQGKLQKRINIIKARFKETNLPIIYCNQLMAQDGIIFDGRSLCYDGQIKIIGKAFETDQQMVEFKDKQFTTSAPYSYLTDHNAEIYQAMVLGTQYYVRNNGFSKIILGLSGGIDSALVAVIAADALGAENVLAYMLPSQFTSSDSIEDAQELAEKLRIKLTTIKINEIVASFAKELAIEKNSITYQNLQSRSRGTILMAEANKHIALLLTTGNKSEYATGYATIYGDMNGAFNPIKDVYKTQLYEIAKYRNIIPERILTKAPSAELAPEQKDSDSLPEYDILDQILYQYIEEDKSKEQLSQQFDSQIVNKVLKLIKNSEFKRKQSAPGVKISSRNFEKERRMPITNNYL